MSDADHLDPQPTPSDEAPPVEPVGRVEHVEPVPEPAVEPATQFPATQFPATQFPATQFPATQFPAPPAPSPPVAPYVPTPTVASVAPAASSVVLPTVAHAPRAKRVLPWAIAAVLGLGAATFAVLWVGKSGDADDLTKARDALATEKAALQKDFDTTKADLQGELDDAQKALDSANGELDASKGDNDDLQQQVDDLQTNVDDLTQQLSDASVGGVFPESALALGQLFSARANPALPEADQRCLGQGILDDIGMDHLFAGVILGDSNAVDELATAAVRAARRCGISASQLAG